MYILLLTRIYPSQRQRSRFAVPMPVVLLSKTPSRSISRHLDNPPTSTHVIRAIDFVAKRSKSELSIIRPYLRDCAPHRSIEEVRYVLMRLYQAPGCALYAMLAFSTRPIVLCCCLRSRQCMQLSQSESKVVDNEVLDPELHA